MTTDSTQSSGRGRIALLAILTIAVVGVIVFAMIQQNIGRGGESAAPTSTATPSSTDDAETDEGDAEVEVSSTPGTYLTENMNGQEAIDALGDDIEVVAKRNGKTVEELTDLLLRDETAYISPNGFLMFKDGITKK